MRVMIVYVLRLYARHGTITEINVIFPALLWRHERIDFIDYQYQTWE